jgi:drug/metabolite transporter (DMT)-like permease
VTWFVFAILTAVVYGGQAAYLKGLTDEIDQMLVTWSLFLFALPMYAAALVYTGVPVVESSFWWACLVSLGVNLAAWPAFVRAVRLSDISLVMPLLAFTPAFVLVIEYLMLGATPDPWGLAGIAMITFGAYVLNIEQGFSGLFDPVRAVGSDRGALYMLFVAGIWSISATVEKITVTSSSPAFYLTTLAAGFVVCFFPIMRTVGDATLEDVRHHWPVLAGAGGLTGLMALLQMSAIEMTPLVNYVISIKRAGMLVSVLFGWLLFSERNIGFRLIGAALMVGGVMLIRIV